MTSRKKDYDIQQTIRSLERIIESLEERNHATLVTLDDLYHVTKMNQEKIRDVKEKLKRI